MTNETYLCKISEYDYNTNKVLNELFKIIHSTSNFNVTDLLNSKREIWDIIEHCHHNVHWWQSSSNPNVMNLVRFCHHSSKLFGMSSLDPRIWVQTGSLFTNHTKQHHRTLSQTPWISFVITAPWIEVLLLYIQFLLLEKNTV